MNISVYITNTKYIIVYPIFVIESSSTAILVRTALINVSPEFASYAVFVANSCVTVSVTYNKKNII